MEKYYMPAGMKYTTIDERRLFYEGEFNTRKVAEWFGQRINKLKFAVIIGKHTGIFLQKYYEDAETTIIIDEYRNLEEVHEQISEFLPESVYYDRTVYGKNDQKMGQELAFDLDPENVTCPVHGNLAEKMQRGQGLSFCGLELQMVKEQTLNLLEYLEKDFSNLQIVYSGRGFHVHVFDKKAYQLSGKERREIARKVKQKGFAIDEWITVGEMRFIRLPYSLHGLVSRMVLPLEKSELASFNPVSDARCIPRFLRKSISS